MKIKYLLCAFALLSIFLSAEVASAQFSITNASNVNMFGAVWWAHDDCSNQGANGFFGIPAGTTVTQPVAPTGAYKAFFANDGCGSAGVEHPTNCIGFGTTVATFTDCAGNTRTVVWVSENQAFIL